MRRLVVGALGLAVLCGLTGPATAAESEPVGGFLARIVIDGSINPGVAQFVHEAVGRAREEGAAALVIEMDTPGGLMPSMKAIVKDLLDAPLPVIVWVAPRGAGAGSAGVFITLAAHVAAMAPGTNIGAAHPVGGQGEDIKGKMGEKIENSAASFIEAIANQRGRNAEWAIKAVRESVSITADEAVRTKVVDFVAKDLDEVVAKADGREVEVGGGKRTLALAKEVRGADDVLRVRTYAMTLAQRIMNRLGDPNIAALLMMAALLGLYVEFTNPGVVFPGVAGVICLLLALAALQVLPLNTSGLGLLVLGIALLVAEAFVPSFGVLGLGGVVAVVLGFLFLFDPSSGVAVSPSVAYGVGGTAGAIMFVLAVLVFRSQRRRVTHGPHGMVGEIAVARGRLDPEGSVALRGEHWTAESDEPIEAGERVEVTAVDGLRLRVRRAPGRPPQTKGGV